MQRPLARRRRKPRNTCRENPWPNISRLRRRNSKGDRGKAEAAFHKMTLFPDTKLLGLRGLHIEARRRDDAEAAHHFAKAAHDIAPLPWAGSAVLEHYTAQGEWEKARAAIEESFRAKAIDLPDRAATARGDRNGDGDGKTNREPARGAASFALGAQAA